jgi:uncharacterized Fe-S center protein
MVSNEGYGINESESMKKIGGEKMSEVILIQNNFLNEIESALNQIGIDNIKNGAKVAIKLHMGEYGNLNHVRPSIVGRVVEVVKSAGGEPFLFDTTTLYPGSRSTVEKYLETARRNGFTDETVGCPIVISNEGIDVETDGPLRNVEIAKDMLADALVVISHAKGHPDLGFGGAIKNLGMGGVTRKSKGIIHAGSRPVLAGICNSCGDCYEACKNGAITMERGGVVFDYSRCFGCGACIYACSFEALKPRIDDIGVLLAEAAFAVLRNFDGDKQFFVNVLLDIAPLCDCIAEAGFPICNDIGILLSKDPVAIDEASIDLIEEKGEKDIFFKLHKVDPKRSTDAGEKFGMGSKKYEIE